MAKRSYADAITALNSIQTNFAIIKTIRESGRAKNENAIREMIEWCRRAGINPRELDRLNPIHIAGTKGKGSTSAFISSILMQHIGSSKDGKGVPTKVGLYTSPHLRYVRERIQINNVPISEQDFADSFFTVWDNLERAEEAGAEPIDNKQKPVYFRFLTLVAFHTYLKEKVDSAVIECGIGGEYDSTNVIVNPSVTGITSLGIDHTFLLGDTVESIAWHKAGILKEGAYAFTVPQPGEAMRVLEERAKERNVELKVVDVHADIANGKVKLGLASEVQKINASLAVEVAAAHLRKLGHSNISTNTLPLEFVAGLEQVKWAGRCDTRVQGDISWHLDGAHTAESVKVAAEWFAEVFNNEDMANETDARGGKIPPILLFNQQERAGLPLLHELNSVLSSRLHARHPFSHAVFCSNVTFGAGKGYSPDLVSMNANSEAVESLEVQKKLANAWKGIDAKTQVHVEKTIEDGVVKCRAIAQATLAQRGASCKGEKVRILVVGSVHLVGGVLEVIETTV